MTMHRCSCGPLLLLLSVALCHVVGSDKIVVDSTTQIVGYGPEDKTVVITQLGPLPSRRDGHAVLQCDFVVDPFSSEPMGWRYFSWGFSSKPLGLTYYSRGYVGGRQSMYLYLAKTRTEAVETNYKGTVVAIDTAVNDGEYTDAAGVKKDVLVVSSRLTIKTDFSYPQSLRQYHCYVKTIGSKFGIASLNELDYEKPEVRLNIKRLQPDGQLQSGDTDYGREVCRNEQTCRKSISGPQIITCRLLNSSSRWNDAEDDIGDISILVGNKVLAGTGDGSIEAGLGDPFRAEVAASDREWIVKQMMYADDQAAGEGQVGDYYTATLRVKYNVPEDTSLTCTIVEPLFWKQTAVYLLQAEVPPATCKAYTGRYTTLSF